jgi:hypothetical protein
MCNMMKIVIINIIYLLGIIFLSEIVNAQTIQSIQFVTEENNNRFVFINNDELQPGWITQTGESNSIIVFNDSLRIPLFLIRQYGNNNRALMVQISADSTGIENNQNSVRIKQKGKGNSATVIQHN